MFLIIFGFFWIFTLTLQWIGETSPGKWFREEVLWKIFGRRLKKWIEGNRERERKRLRRVKEFDEAQGRKREHVE
jgi:hypothetical protein